MLLLGAFAGQPNTTSKKNSKDPSAAVNTYRAAIEKVMPGDIIYTILKRQGFTESERQDAISGMTLPSGFGLASGEKYFVFEQQKNKKKEIHFFLQGQEKSLRFLKTSSDVSSDLMNVPFERKVFTANGVIKGSLIESLTRAIGDELTSYRFMDAFLLDFRLPKDIERGAEFKLTYEKLYYKNAFIRYGEILRAELELRGNKVSRVFEPIADGGIFYDPEKKLTGRPFYSPVDYIKITSLFQPRRMHPIRGKRIPHLGIDFELPSGSPLYAAASGVIESVGRNRAAGNFVVIDHQNGYKTYYNHLLKSSSSLIVGEKVGPGTNVGQVGCSGYCTKPHLHFAVKKNGVFVDPQHLVLNYSFRQRDAVKKIYALND